MKAFIIIISVLYASSLAHRTSKQRWEAMNIYEKENFDPGSQGLFTTPPTTSTTAPTKALTKPTDHKQKHNNTNTIYAEEKVGVSALTIVILAIALYLLQLARKRCQRNVPPPTNFLAEAVGDLQCAPTDELNS